MTYQPDVTKYFALALDPVHVGTGDMRLGRVDMSIVREPGTNLPKIPGTSLAGACRTYAAMQKDGKVLSSKLLWAMGNFSRFVRPGMVRVDVTYDDNRTLLDAATSVMASAYLNKKPRELVVVLINTTKGPQPVSLAGLKVRDNTFATYTTSETTDLVRGSVKVDAISLPARSVVTLVGRAE